MQFVDVDVGGVLVDDVGQLVQRPLCRVIHLTQISTQLLAQSRPQLGVLVVHLSHAFHAARVQLTDGHVQRRRLPNTITPTTRPIAADVARAVVRPCVSGTLCKTAEPIELRLGWPDGTMCPV